MSTTKSGKSGIIGAIVLNAFIVAAEIICIIISFADGGAGIFCFYTQDSNVLAMIAGAVYVAFAVKALKTGGELPRWVSTLRYTAACCLMVTFIVVIAVLIPMRGTPDAFHHYMLDGTAMFFHMICPLVSFVSLMIFEHRAVYSIISALKATIPTFIYAAVTIILNLTYMLNGPYPFLRVYNQPWYMSVMWFFVIVGGDFLFAWLISFVCGKIRKASEKKAVQTV